MGASTGAHWEKDGGSLERVTTRRTVGGLSKLKQTEDDTRPPQSNLFFLFFSVKVYFQKSTSDVAQRERRSTPAE